MDFADRFRDPPTDLRVRPLWQVEAALTPAHAQWLCGQLRDKGLGGAVLLPAPGAEAASALIARAGGAMGLRMRDLGAEPDCPDHAGLRGAMARFTWEEASPAHLKRVADLLALSDRPAPLPWPLRDTVAAGADQPYAASLFYQAPAWPYLRALADYAARLNLLTASARRADAAPGLVVGEAAGARAAYWSHEGGAFALIVNTGGESATVDLELLPGHRAEAWNLEDGGIGPAGLEPGAPAALALAPCAARLFLVAPGDAVPAPKAPPPAGVAVAALATTPYHATPYGGGFLRFEPDWGGDDGVAVFHIARPLANLRVITDRRALAGAEILLDGSPLPKPDGWEMDLSLARHPLPASLAPGAHSLTVRSDAVPGALLLARHCWLAGDFGVGGAPSRPELFPVPGLAEGPWETQGLPHFSGTLAYAMDYDWPDGPRPRRVTLDAGGVGQILEVEVNGRPAGTRLWPPYAVDVTELIRPGAPNLFILKVANGLGNLLAGPDPRRPSGLLDPVALLIEN